MLTLEQRRHAEVEKYRRVYRDYPNYTNREVRIELTREWLKKWPQAVTLLDVGCGLGEVLDMAREETIAPRGCEVLGELCHRGDVDWIPGAHDLPYPDDDFDLVTCTDVMEHLLEDDVPDALREIARVARGPILLTICHREDTPGKYGPDKLHITVHPREWWEEQIREHMGAEPMALYTDRVNENGTWFEVMV